MDSFGGCVPGVRNALCNAYGGGPFVYDTGFTHRVKVFRVDVNLGRPRCKDDGSAFVRSFVAKIFRRRGNLFNGAKI